MTDIFDAGQIDILDCQDCLFLNLQVVHGAIRALAILSTLANAFVPPQVPIDRQSSLFLYHRTSRCPARPLFHPNPLLSPSYRLVQFCLLQNPHRKRSISSYIFPSCSVASPWSRESQVFLLYQLRSCSSPLRHKVGFRH